MPVAERPDQVAEGQAYGEAAAQTDFIEQTTPQGDELEPMVYEPEDDDGPELDPNEPMAQGADLLPDEFQALLDGGASDDLDAEDVEDLREWSGLVKYAANQPGASREMRTFFALLERMTQDD